MYAFIKGTVDEIGDNYVVLDCNDVGYEIFVPTTVIHLIPSRGSQIKLYTYLNVREDAMILYGFLSKDDKNIFKMLLQVSGIGPKGALAILSALTPDDLRFAILAGDDKAICKAQGIGKKMAQKLIIELKDKLDLNEALELSSKHQQDQPMSAYTDAKNDAISALVALGYSSTESMRVVTSIETTEDMDAEQIIKLALKKLAF
ncbi:MAG: Holliday junction branch migration protein RuvA [Lachnospiraceae bacterium]|nr:Holliday junction branch migration protein RuvA [Lachnospiraceae bacterium]